ncbi:pyruvate dehydrogenase complex dihydrolipoamide acetyltransferase [Pacificimonas flava]|uniref:Acetyltransferase component of pyruvate dehydrogenase complex n=2 Tax=Pacificimonas TaxID=1960290 RepID=A0A219B8K2_9SPHN|nr:MULTISPECIES: pyruvate dehydrogenase complex dihydrolipoamide acetyltransferase [Pacificimonas]MBZ6379963.1 pyruvate dehydrogenase complex dihydrolipoamide acetyltransferase [Pacificimonas aurantium]OWV34483.1 pyruvate dehydrogenase complex dihydrolipoamide acetyltransferase [Pacificimonas flava]
MATELTMPALSPTMEVGTLSKWLVKEGDSVEPGDLLAEIETDKATMEFEAVDPGVIAKILVEEGTDEVAVGTPIAILAEEGEDPADVEAPEAKKEPELKARAEDEPTKDEEQAPAPKPAPAPKAKEAGYGRDDTQATGGDDLPAAGPAPVKDGERLNVTPLARRIAEAKGVDLGTVEGTGPKGRIVKADVEGASAAPAQASAKAAGDRSDRPAKATDTAVQTKAGADAPYETEKLSNIRKVTARRLTESKQTVPHYYLTVDCNLDALLTLRKQLNGDLEARGVKLSVNDLLVKALAVALTEVPDANVQFAGDEMIRYGRADISVAVAIDGGLITPIIRDAAEKRLSTISEEMSDLAARARDGKLKPEEFQGGTASLSNLGMYGIKQFEAVINPPQGMILAVGAGEKRPYVVDDALSIATVMSATGSFDHRAIDGATGAQLMAAFKRLIESPMGMLA